MICSAKELRSAEMLRKNKPLAGWDPDSGKGKCVIREINTFILAQKINFVKEHRYGREIDGDRAGH